MHTGAAKGGNGAGLSKVKVLAGAPLAGNRAEGFSEVAHDVRNMVAALSLYCELLKQPGVLAESYAHYGDELQQVASASERLAEKLAELNDSMNITQLPPPLQ